MFSHFLKMGLNKRGFGPSLVSVALVAVLAGCGGKKTGLYDAAEEPIAPPDHPPEEGTLSAPGDDQPLLNRPDAMAEGLMVDPMVPATLTPEELPGPMSSTSTPPSSTTSVPVTPMDGAAVESAGGDAPSAAATTPAAPVKPAVKPKGELPKGSVKVSSGSTSHASSSSAPEPDTMTFTATKKAPPAEPAL